MHGRYGGEKHVKAVVPAKNPFQHRMGVGVKQRPPQVHDCPASWCVYTQATNKLRHSSADQLYGALFTRLS
mgnify:CR=1 FL=1